jgi:hypothetical protein
LLTMRTRLSNRNYKYNATNSPAWNNTEQHSLLPK